MKLATLKDGSRDGRLVVVSRDLTRCTDASFLAPTVQAALDDWYRISPHLAALSQSLEVGAVPSIRFHEHDAHAPLPRAYQHIGCSDSFSGPRDPVSQGGSGHERNAAIALIAGDRPDGSDSSDSVAILVALAVVPAGGADGVSAFSPVAVTPDEFEDGFQPLQVSLNGKLMAQDASPMTLDDLVAVLVRAEQARPIEAGAIIAAPSGADVSLHAGDTLRVEMKDRAGHSIFGAIEQASASSHSG